MGRLRRPTLADDFWEFGALAVKKWWALVVTALLGVLGIVAALTGPHALAIAFGAGAIVAFEYAPFFAFRQMRTQRDAARDEVAALKDEHAATLRTAAYPVYHEIASNLSRIEYAIENDTIKRRMWSDLPADAWNQHGSRALLELGAADESIRDAFSATQNAYDWFHDLNTYAQELMGYPNAAPHIKRPGITSGQDLQRAVIRAGDHALAALAQVVPDLSGPHGEQRPAVPDEPGSEHGRDG